MIVKLTKEQIGLVGATSAAEFAEKFVAFCDEAKELKDMADTTPDFAALEKRVKALEEKAPVAAGISEAKANELISAALPAWAASEPGKKLIGAEASRITAEALAGVGTQPVKPSPANDAKPSVDALIAAGKFEEAYAASPALQAEFSDAKLYATFAKAVAAGKIATR